ncbi:MAG: nitroreductase family protein [Firmicutes bacterium]|nr:nitroreductase family protein [Bacillota bacterium]
MNLIEIMRNRRSIRKYTEEAVSEEKLQQILQAGLLAPTSRGKRPWEFYVVKDKEMLEKLSKAKQHGAALIAGCDAAIAVFADSDLSDAWIEDSSIALAYMDLMASSLGVGSCWVQMRMRKDENDADAEKNVQRIMGLQEPFRMVGILALGMPAEEKEPYELDELKWEKVHR